MVTSKDFYLNSPRLSSTFFDARRSGKS